MSDNNNNNANAGEESNNSSSARKRKADGSDPSPRGKKLGNDLLASLENPDLCDVTLVGSDGGRVPAIRIYLSARSEMLQSLLVGQFREASEEEVRMDYPAAVLKAIVHFCCTDEVPDLSAMDADIVESMRLAIKLVDAADYCGLVLLKKKAQTAVGNIVNAKQNEPQVWGRCICSAFEETSRKPSLGAWSRHLYRCIVRIPEGSLITGDRPGATLLSSTNLRTIAEEPALRARASIIFNAIRIWLDNDAPIDEESLESNDDRRSFAKHLASNLELHMIHPDGLIGSVSDSGLAVQGKIMQALQRQCHGGRLGIYGCGLSDGTSIAYRVNGVYEETAVNATFESVAADNPMRVWDKKRFDKSTDDIKLTIFSYIEDRGQHFWLVAPPAGAGNVVLTGDFKRIPEENKLLYAGHRFIRIAKADGSDVKWSLPTGSIKSDDVKRQSK